MTAKYGKLFPDINGVKVLLREQEKRAGVMRIYHTVDLSRVLQGVVIENEY